MACRITGDIPKVKRIKAQDAGHFLHYQEPAIINREIEIFLNTGSG